MARTLTVDVPKALWLTSNRHNTNRGWLSSIRRDLQALAAARAVEQELQPLPGKYVARWTIHYPKGVRADKGDAANAQPTTKALLDGLVPRWLDDDGPLNVTEERFRRGPNLDVPAVHVVVLDLMPVEPDPVASAPTGVPARDAPLAAQLKAFETFWERYPTYVGTRSALSAWARAVRAGIPAVDLIEALSTVDTTDPPEAALWLDVQALERKEKEQ